MFDLILIFYWKDWAARLLIERSRAIKSPNIQLHLVGAKRIQQALCEENVLERFITDKKMAEMIRATFVDQFSFNVYMNLIFDPWLKNFEWKIFDRIT